MTLLDALRELLEKSSRRNAVVLYCTPTSAEGFEYFVGPEDSVPCDSVVVVDGLRWLRRQYGTTPAILRNLCSVAQDLERRLNIFMEDDVG